ncbi:hypothetical protein [Maricaulis salignorans]|uniref:hypothetical protein n=1 Tax=Maricaulis salignorans TaxID=144026 RepID=UPI003A915CEC
MTDAKGKKGLIAEELVRAYFLLAGFYVVRGVPLKFSSMDLTDIDVWVYERSATLARRRTIIDIKDKRAPQAAERLFFVTGLATTIGVEGAGVATSDTRPALRELARKHKLIWIDGKDLARLKSSRRVAELDRLTDEEFTQILAAFDSDRGRKYIQNHFLSVKSSVGDRFGISSANTALDTFQILARDLLSSHPNSAAATTLGRVCYYSASIAAASFDFSSADTALRPTQERIKEVARAIRFGTGSANTLEKIEWARRAIREYVTNGTGVAEEFQRKISAAFDSIKSEGLAEVVVKLSNSDKLFNIARSLESAAYQPSTPSFDNLGPDEKAFVGALLDFSEIERVKFAKSWVNSVTPVEITRRFNVSEPDQQNDEHQEVLL